jgi:hypothetical protein
MTVVAPFLVMYLQPLSDELKSSGTETLLSFDIMSGTYEPVKHIQDGTFQLDSTYDLVALRSSVGRRPQPTPFSDQPLRHIRYQRHSPRVGVSTISRILLHK